MLDPFKSLILGAKDVAINAPKFAVDKSVDAVLGTIGGITSWAWGSMCNVLAGTGKFAVKAIASSPIIPGSKF